MLLFDETKQLEEAIGEKGAAVIAHILERQGTEQAKREKEELASKHDIALVRKDLDSMRLEMQAMEIRLMHNLTLRLGGMMVACAGIVIAVLRLLG